jgi:hypothetical protein
VACGRVPGITLKTAVVPAEFTCAGCGRSRAAFHAGLTLSQHDPGTAGIRRQRIFQQRQLVSPADEGCPPTRHPHRPPRP